jgi:peptidoglycan/xylan/chitin deacetylase (PgdA/CDA1 family)
MLAILGVLFGGAILATAAFLMAAALQEYRRDRVPTLLYHRFLDAESYARARAAGEDLSYVTEAGAFEAQMEHLAAAGYTTITLDQFLEFHQRGATLPPRPIVITCDDGFESNYRHAFPVWKRLGMRATIFMTPDRNSENFARFARFDTPLTDAQMVEMSRNGVAIESHGMTHRFLSDLPEDEARWELEEARVRLASSPSRAGPTAAWCGAWRAARVTRRSIA